MIKENNILYGSIKTLSSVALIALTLNIIWEFAHHSLYVDLSGIPKTPHLILASLTDMLIVLGIFTIVTWKHKTTHWVKNPTRSDILIIVGTGLAVALLIEAVNLNLGRWEYTKAMPTVLGIGVSPLIQLASTGIISLTAIRLISMKHSIENQTNFSSLLFDTLFGLIIYFNIDSFLLIKEPVHMVFYVTSLILTVYWWILMKSAADVYDKEISHSTVDIVFGITQIIIVEHIALMSKNFDTKNATLLLILLIAIDLIWCLSWRFIGNWANRGKKKIVLMEKELNSSIGIDMLALLMFIPLAIFHDALTPAWYVGLFIAFLSLDITLAYRYKIIDLKLF